MGRILKEIPATNGARTDLKPSTGGDTRLDAGNRAGLSKDQQVIAKRVAAVRNGGKCGNCSGGYGRLLIDRD